MMRPIDRILLAVLPALFCDLSRAAGYDESVHGDLANDRLNPTPIAMSSPDIQIAGTVTFGDRDYFTAHVPSGTALAAILLEQYDSSNSKAFLGVQAGNTFTVDPDLATPSDLLGYIHFGFDSALGSDLLDDLAAAPGAMGFAAPLGPGDYTFWVNQTEPAQTAYRLNFVVVPEPAAAALITVPLTVACLRRRRGRRFHHAIHPPQRKRNPMYTLRFPLISIALTLGLISAQPTHAAITVTQPYRGITRIVRSETLPRNELMNIVQIDLTDPDIHFKLSPGSPPSPNTFGSETSVQTTLNFLNQEQAQLAFNVHFFDNPPQGNGGTNLTGFAASMGNVYSAFDPAPVLNYAILPNAPVLNIDASNHATIAQRGTSATTLSDGSGSLSAFNSLSGSAQIITNGVVTLPTGIPPRPGTGVNGVPPVFFYTDQIAARTAVGLSPDGSTLSFFTVDAAAGRLGMTISEMATVMLNDYGIHNALNLDGGGSTTVAMLDPISGISSVVHGASAGQRLVGSSFAVFAVPEPSIGLAAVGILLLVFRRKERVTKFAGFIGFFLVGLGSASADTFTIAVIPDTQFYSANTTGSNSVIFSQQTQWIVDNAAARGIGFVTQLGDVVDTAGPAGSPSAQWNVAVPAMNTLKNSAIPYSILPGNHDWTVGNGTGTPEHYRARFGDQSDFYTGKSWSLGFDDRGINTAQRFSTPLGDMLHIALEWNAALPPTAIPGAAASPLAWAQSIINANPGIPTIIATHNNVNVGNVRDTAGNNLFNNLVKTNNQVFMVLSGHYSNASTAEGRIDSTNNFGRPVYELLSDYQSRNRGGDGWLRLMQFDSAANTIGVQTYTPLSDAALGVAAGPAFGNVGKLETDADSQFILPLNFATRFAALPLQKVFRQGTNGYSGTQDTYIASQGPTTTGTPDPTDYRNANWGNLQSVFMDDRQRVNGSDTDFQFQGLVRFDGLFGNGANQVPADALIESAFVSFVVGGPGTDPGMGTAPGSGWRLVKMLQTWDESSNWNSLTNGVTADGVESLFLATAPGSSSGTTASVDGTITMDVTALVQAWQADPSSNFGVGLLQILGGFNGTRVWSSEAALEANRPSLSVNYSVVPEPASAILAAMSLAPVLFHRRRKANP